MTELKPCPFCGSEALLEDLLSIDSPEVFVRCEYCWIEQPLYDTPEEAIEAWNRRAE